MAKAAFYGRTSHSVCWQAQTGWKEHVHPAPRQMLIPARQTANALVGHDTAQPPQLNRAGSPHAYSSPAAPVDAARLAIRPAGKTKRRMRPPITS
jgi:hypothetical protein